MQGKRRSRRRVAKRRRQLGLALGKGRGWGGKRAGAGRKRAPGRRRCVPHRRRARFSSARPVHVTIRMTREVSGLRTRRIYRVVRDVFCKTADQGRFRICQYSVQHNHIHLLVEASDRAVRKLSG